MPSTDNMPQRLQLLRPHISSKGKGREHVREYSPRTVRDICMFGGYEGGRGREILSQINHCLFIPHSAVAKYREATPSPPPTATTLGSLMNCLLRVQLIRTTTTVNEHSVLFIAIADGKQHQGSTPRRFTSLVMSSPSMRTFSIIRLFRSSV